MEKAQALLSPLLDRAHLHAWATASHRFIVAGQMATGLFHELRNLLEASKTQVENLKGLTSASNPYLTFRSIRYLQELLDCHHRVYDLSSKVLGTLKQTEPMPVSVRTIVEQVLDLLSPSAKQAGTLIEKDLADVPNTLIPPQILIQALLNLSLNAISLMDGTWIGAKRLSLKLRYDQHDDSRPITLCISDTGPGIHDSDVELIFEPGFSTKPGGTGLGLGISRHLVHSIGGTLFLKETCRFGGSTFVMKFPLNT